MKRFQWKWIFTGSKTCCTIWRPFWFAMAAMAAKIQKSSDLGKIWFPSRSWSCELIIVIVFGMGNLGVGWCPQLLCNGNSSYYYHSSSSSSPKPICPTKFSETDGPTFTKLHKKVDPHLKRSHQVLEFSKWPPLPWKPLTYVKIIDLTYIGNCQRVSTRLGVYIK